MFTKSKLLTKEAKNQLALAICFQRGISNGAGKLVRFLMDFKEGERVDRKLLASQLGISKSTVEKYFKELRDKKVLAYERKPRNAQTTP